jgi:hypothetical protein
VNLNINNTVKTINVAPVLYFLAIFGFPPLLRTNTPVQPGLGGTASYISLYNNTNTPPSKDPGPGPVPFIDLTSGALGCIELMGILA